MENKDLNNNSVGYVPQSLEDSSAGAVHQAPSEVDSLSLEPEAQVMLSSQEQAHKGQTNVFLRFARRLDVLLVLLLVVGGVIAFLTISNAKKEHNNTADNSGADNYGQQTIPLGELISGKDLSLSGSSNVTINGPLQLNNSFSVTPSLQPTGAKAGQIYYDKDNNQLAYYNGTNFVFLTSAPDLSGLQSLGSNTQQITSVGTGLSLANGQVDNTGVLSVQGVNGDVTFTAGAGIVINGTNFSNSGILSVAAGSPNVIVNNDGNGNITLDIAAVPGSGTVTSSGGSNGTIPLFTSSQNIEDSIVTQSGLTVTISGDLSVVTGGLTLSSALTVSNGGTGATSLAGNGVLIGNGTAAVNAVASASPGLCLVSTSGAPVWAACPSGNGVNSLNSLTGALNIANASAAGSTITIDDATTTTKGIASFNSTNFSVTGGAVNTAQNINSGATPTFAGVNTNTIIPNAALTVGISAQTALLQGSTTTITSNGAGNNIVLNSAASIELQDNTNVTGNVTTTGDLAVNGGDITSTGALNITPSGTLTVGSTSQTLTLQGGASTSFRATSGASSTVVAFTSPTANTTLNFPALAAGTYTICTTSGNCAGAGTTLQSAYNNSSSPEIVLDATRGALTIRDNASAIGANLLEVQNNAGSATYLAVTANGIAVTGTANVSSDVNSQSGALQTAGTTRIDNSGNGVNLGNLTLTGAISGGTTITGSGNINSTGGALQTNGVSRVDNGGNLINIAAVTASGSATFQGGSLSLGTNSQAGTVVLNDGSSNTGTLAVAALGQNTIYTLPDPGSPTATICLTTGNCSGVGGGVTSPGGTTNKLAKFTGSNTIADSTISDNGTDVTVSVDVVIQGGDLTVGSASQAASVVLHDGNGQTTTLQAGNSAGNMTFILPTNVGSANQCLKQSGTGNQLVWQDCDGGAGGSSATLQTTYNNSTDPEIVLDSSVGGLTLRDNSTPLGSNLFEIQNNLGSTTYLGVSVSGLSVTGTSSATGNINSTGGALQTNGVSRIDNSGNAVNIGNITGTGAITIASVGAGNDITINGADQFIVQDSAVFNALSTFNANVDVGGNDIVGTTGNINLSNFDVVGATGNVTAGTYNGQTISSSANFTGTVAIAGNTTLAADLAVNGGDITSTGVLNITPGGALTVGVSAQTALLQGSTTTIKSNGAGNDIVLDSAASIKLLDDTDITGNVTAGTYNGQTISTSANFTGTLGVAGDTTLTGDLAVNGGDITSTGALNITPGGALTIGATSQALTLQGGPTTRLRATNGANTTTVAFVSPTANTTLNFPALAAGTYTICTTSGNCSGASATLQSTYDNSNDPEIVLDATRGALTIRDNASAIGANLLEVQNNAGSTTYFGVTASGVAVTGTATVSGDINTTGGVIKTNGTTRVDNTGNLVNIAAVTASGSATFQGGNVTLGTNSQAGTIVLNDGSSNTGTLQVAALGQNTVYTLPDPGGPTASICLTTGNCSGVGGGVTTPGGTTNKLSKFTGSQAIGDSSISDDGTNVTVAVDVIIQGGDLTVGTTSQAASIVLHDGNGQTTTLQAGDSAGNLNFILPTNVGSANQCLKQSGTGNQLVWQDCDGGAGGSTATLQTAYDNSTNPEIVLNGSVGGLTIRDNSTPLGANLFEIQNNLGGTTYLAVTVSGLSVTGATSSTGNINSSGGALQTNSTSRIDNSGNLVNIGNITGTGAITIASVGAGNDITVNGADQFIVQDASVFNALSTFNANLDVGANDIVGTTGNINLTNFDVVGSTGNVTAGTYNGQTISSSASFTGTVAVAGNTTLTGDLAVNGGDITSTGALNITPGGTLTVGATGQQLILQGSATTRLTATGSGFTTALGFSGTPVGTVNYNLDRAAAAGTYTICTSVGNCSGVGGGVTTLGGTTGALAKFTGAQTLGDSLLSESGSTVTVNGNMNIVSGNQFQVNGTQISSANLSNDADLAKLGASQTFTGNTVSFKNGTNSTNAFNVQNVGGNRILTVDSTGGQIVLGTSTTLDGKIVFNNVSNSNTVTILPGAPTANRTLTLPDASGILCTDSGNCAGAGATLQTGYNFSVGGTTPKIKINSSLLGVDIQDADTPVATNLLNIRASNGAGLGSVLFGVGNTGQIVMQNSANSATALRLLTSGGTSVLTGDTNAGKIILGQSSTLNGTLVFTNATNGNTVTLTADTATANRAINLPDADGIICLSTGNCSGSGSSNTLQAAYDAGNALTTTTARNVNFTLADTATDSSFNVTTATNATGFTTFARANGAGTADPAQLILIDNLDVDRVQPIGLKIQSAAGNLTTAIDLTDPEIVTALSFAANDIVGTTGNIDMTNFDVTGSNGNIVTAGDAAINGGDITSTGALNITPSGALTAGNTAQAATLQGSITTITSTGAGNDIILNSADIIALQDATTVTGDFTQGSGNFSSTSTGSASLTAGGAITITAGGGSTWSTSSGNLTVQAATTNTLTLTTGGAGTVALGDQNATTINIGRGSNIARTINIGTGGTSTTQTVIVGSTGGASATTVQAGTGNLNLLTNSATAKIIAKSQVDSTTAFQVQNSGGGYVLNVDTTNAVIGLALLNVGINGLGATIDTYYNAASLEIGTTNAGAITLGNATNSTVAIQGNNGTSAVSIQAAAGGKISVGTAANNVIAIGTGTVAGTVTIGGTGQTGALTLGQSTATNTISIGAAIGNAATQTINIGTSATAGSITTATIGSAIGTSSTTIKGGTGASAITLAPGSGGSINLTTLGAGNVNLNTASSIIAKTTTNSTTAFQVQNASSSAILNVNTSTNVVTISGDLVQAGIQPAVSAGNGTVGPTSSLAAGAGGNTSGTTGQTAGNGGSYFIDGGAGGTAPSGSSNGWGGNVFISGGAAGAGAGTAGLRGNVILQGNAGVVGIGTFSPNSAYKIDAAGDINISTGSAFRINGVAICTTTICKTNLQTAYDGSTSPEIVLDTTRGALTIRRDAAAAVTTLFEIQDNAGSNTYFNVTTGGAFMNGGTFNTTDSGTILAGTFRTGDATAPSTASNIVNLNSGQVSGTNSTSGAVFVRSGHSTTSGNTGAVTIISGNATSGTSGGIVIDSGSGSVGSGPIIVGGTYAPTITLGRTAANIVTTINGTTVFKTAAANSANAVNFQDTASVSMLRVDTTNKFIVVGDDTTAGGANASLLIGDTCTNTKQCISIFEGLDINAVTGGDTDVMQMQGGAGMRFSTGYGITSRMVITGTGKVGIGTENPTEALTVQGNFNITDGSTKGYRVRTSGGSIDMEASGAGVPGELWISGWTAANFTGTQVNWFRMSSGSRLIMTGTGTASATPIQLELDHKSSASGAADPGGFSGAMYYNDSLDKFRCYQAGEWRNCVSGVTTLGVVGGATAGNTVSTTYANMPGTSSVSFTKDAAATNLVVTLNTSATSTVAATVVRLAIRVNGTDYDCANMAFNATATHLPMSCTIVIPSIPVGAQTIQARWKRVSGTGTVATDSNDWINVTAQETD